MVTRISEWLDDFMRREAARGKWSFLVKIGLIGWGVLMLCAINLWFLLLTNYPPLRTFLLSLVFWLIAGVSVGLGFYRNAQWTREEQRERWMQQRQRGETSFVWRYGVLRFGTPIFGTFSVLLGFTAPKVPVMLFTWVLALSLVFGAAFGIILWAQLEKKFPLP